MRPPPAILGPHEGCYFQRPPERLVLEGYRRWLAGYDSGSVTPWEMTQALYEELLGAAEGLPSDHWTIPLELIEELP